MAEHSPYSSSLACQMGQRSLKMTSSRVEQATVALRSVQLLARAAAIVAAAINSTVVGAW